MIVLLAALLAGTWGLGAGAAVVGVRSSLARARADRAEREFLIRVALSRHVTDVAAMDKSRSEATARVARAVAAPEESELIAEINKHLELLHDEPTFNVPGQPEGL